MELCDNIYIYIYMNLTICVYIYIYFLRDKLYVYINYEIHVEKSLQIHFATIPK